MKKLYPQAQMKSIRGNVLTRLEKLDAGEYGTLILAAAGLKRLGFEDRISRYFSPEEMIPAAGQGILCVQGRAGEDYSYLTGFDSADSRDCAAAERAFVAALGGGCSSPVAAYAVADGDVLTVRGLYFDEEDGGVETGVLSGPRSRAVWLGRQLAFELRERHRGGRGCADAGLKPGPEPRSEIAEEPGIEAEPQSRSAVKTGAEPQPQTAVKPAAENAESEEQ